MTERLMGRAVPKTMFSDEEMNLFIESTNVQELNAMEVIGNIVRCCRCGTSYKKDNVVLTHKEPVRYYCPNCLIMGRIDSDTPLYHVPQKVTSPRKIELAWSGTLTDSQYKISEALIEHYLKGENQLIHAVTGAGKTEMLFQLIVTSLEQGQRVGIASPRVDVCLELYPRIQQAFPEENIVLLHGNQQKSYEYSELVICTTHQLLRFYEAFDLLIIDEVDAFPYVGCDMLAFGTLRSIKPTGKYVYLTATPSTHFLKEEKANRLVIHRLGRRYHGHDLVVPTCHYTKGLQHYLREGRIPYSLSQVLKKTERRILLFFSNIQQMIRMYGTLKEVFPTKKIAYVYAEHEERGDIVLKMRQEEWDWLLTTTILERGVTFSNIDVIVIDAAHDLFTQASLIQIAGRAGRDKAYPEGNVRLFHDGKSRSMVACIREIKRLNKEAK